MRMMGIDPGNVRSAYVIFNTEEETINGDILPNSDLLVGMRMGMFKTYSPDVIVIEKIESYGMPVGVTIFDTVKMTGRIIEICERVGVKCCEISRRDVRLILCNSVRAGDSNIRQVLIDRFGYWKSGKTGKGTKKDPGKLYNVKKDMWSALAVIIAYLEKENK